MKHRAPATVLLGAFVLLCGVGCRNAPSGAVARLTPRDASVRLGDATVLQWQVSGGTLVVIRGADHVELFSNQVSSDGASGNLPISPVVTTTYRLDLVTPDGPISAETTVKVMAGASTPEVHEFVADPPNVPDGESTRLRWIVSGASTLIVSDGILPLLVIDEGSARERGSLVVRPQQATNYILHALNDSGSVSARAYVGVAGRTGILSFTTSAEIVSDGDEVVLGWRTVGADHMTLVDGEGQVLLDTDDRAALAEGVWYVVPGALSTYELTIEGPGGTDASTVEIRSVPAPSIVSFAASSVATMPGEPVSLEWETLGAFAVQVFGATGVVYAGTDASGDVTVSPEATAEYVLLVENEAGASESVAVVVHVDPPGLGFTASTGLIPEYGGEVELSWSAEGAESLTFTPVLTAIELINPAFVDIRASGTRFTFDRSPYIIDDVPIGFDYPWGDGTRSTMSVHFEGVVAFESGVSLSQHGCRAGLRNAIMAMLPVRDPVSGNVATFALRRGGEVHVLRGGVAPERWTVVQWTGLHISDGSTDGVDTFQLLLSENGDATVHVLETWDHDYRNIGWSPPGDRSAVLGCTAAGSMPTSSVRMKRDNTLAMTDSRRTWLQPIKAEAWPMYLTAQGRTGNSMAMVWFSERGAPELRLSEIMYDPPSPTAGSVGEWIEIHNSGDMDLNIGGLTISDGSGSPGHSLPPNMNLPAGAFYIFGTSSDMALNGGVAVDSVYVRDAAMALDDQRDCIELAVAGVALELLCYDETADFPEASGASLAYRPYAIPGTNPIYPLAADWCATVIASPQNGILSSPGAPNARCVEGDDCSAPIMLDVSTGETHVSGDTTLALNDAAPEACFFPLGRDIVYELVLTETQFVRASVSSDRALMPWRPALYLADQSCADVSTPLLSCDAAPSSSAVIQRVLPAGTSYLAVDGTSGLGIFDLSVVLSSPPTLARVVEATTVTNITATGTPLNVASDEAFVNDIDLGFEFPFLGGTYSTIAVSSNGFIATESLAQAHYVDHMLPAVGKPAGVIAPLWDDLVPGVSGAEVTIERSGVAPQRQAIVQWAGFDFFDTSDPSERAGAYLLFQVALFEDGRVEFRYGDLSGGRAPERAAGLSASVGLEAPDGLLGDVYGYHEQILDAGTVVRWSPL